MLLGSRWRSDAGGAPSFKGQGPGPAAAYATRVRLPDALADARLLAAAAATNRPQRLLVAGAGGPLGRAVLEQALQRGGRYGSVGVLTRAPLQPGLRTLATVPHRADDDAPLRADVALIVFDRGFDFHGRDEAYHLPVPAELPSLARRLRAGGVHTLAVLSPVAPGLLPQALRHGLATLDEQAVAAAGFERLLFVRPSQTAPKLPLKARAERLARWMLSQLHYLVPQREQPVRAVSVAGFVFEVLRQWPDAAPGTRVAAPALVWEAAQPGGAEGVVRRWLAEGA